MDELISIIQQRKASISSMSTDQDRKHKSFFIEQQRKRNQRQNWILRVLKTLKILSVDQKKVIFEITIKMMNYYQPTQTDIDDYEHINYIETYINLFVEFYNKFRELDLTHIKTIIRPNNSYIMVDLIKSLIDLGRKEFKMAVLNNFKEPYVSKSARKFSDKTNSKTELAIKMSPRIIEKQKPKSQQNVSCHLKIQEVLFEKYNKAVQRFHPQLLNERFNQLFLDLMYSNNKNASKIQKYLDSCFGVKRHLNYNISGLYTQKEIDKMTKEQKEKALSRAADLKELKGQISAEHLKEYFKIKVEIHSAQNLFQNKTNRFIRPWLPVSIFKSGNKVHPYHQMFQFNGNYYYSGQFQMRTGKKVKEYLKEKLIQFFQRNKHPQLDNLSLIGFNKRQYLDTNNTKLMEVMSGGPRVHLSRKEKQREKEGLLPPIAIYESQDLSRPIKSKSDSKLPTSSLMLPPTKASQKISEILEKRMNHSSLSGEKESKRKIQKLIDTLVKSREYTIQ